MPVNGFLAKLFKSDKDKKKDSHKSSNKSSSSSSHHSSPSTTPQSDLPIVSPTHPRYSSKSAVSSSNSLSQLAYKNSNNNDKNVSSTNMAPSSSSTSVIHPVDSYNHHPHLKLARFLEKRHLKHSDYLKNNKNNNNNNNNNNNSQPLVHKALYPSTASVQHVSLNKPHSSKFNNYEALTELVSQYGYIPDQSVDLMTLLEHTDINYDVKIGENGKVEKSKEEIIRETSKENNEVIEVPRAYTESTALVIGKGAGGSVYPLYDKQNNHLYAMKKLRLQSSKEDWSTYEVKLKNEFKIANKLHHQNLIRTYDLLQDNDLFIIIMDYAPYDFFTMVMAGILTKYEIYCYFKQMCTGVHYMHSIGLAHRDLKLDNCVVDKNGILKIVDFGSSVIFDENLYLKRGKSEKNASATGILGSDPYLAPEVVTVPYYDPSLADVWSLAIIFCCMVLRRFPWRLPKNTDISYNYFISKPGEIIDKDGKKKIVGPDRLLRLLPTSSKHVIDHMLKVDPRERYNMDQVLESHFYNKINNCHYENYDSNRNRGTLIKGTDHVHNLVTNKQFSEEHPDEVVQEKKREEEQAKRILSGVM